ncbi:hypothetical protein H5410_012945 [Solanum commersonii]|uniref:Uncharacterized protein n=1 Tax=Solanum commersonii TaxID=4109 RepID=A0A9J6AU99_SOLCO|nr:hypothetical protein H5410_012945 [Solanum commersonii]
MELVGPDGQIDLFSRSNEPHSSCGASWSRRPNQPIFKVKRALEQVNPPFCQFSYAIVHVFFCDTKFQRDFCRKFLWTSVYTLVMEPVGPDG